MGASSLHRRSLDTYRHTHRYTSKERGTQQMTTTPARKVYGANHPSSFMRPAMLRQARIDRAHGRFSAEAKAFGQSLNIAVCGPVRHHRRLK